MILLRPFGNTGHTSRLHSACGGYVHSGTTQREHSFKTCWDLLYDGTVLETTRAAMLKMLQQLKECQQRVKNGGGSLGDNSEVASAQRQDFDMSVRTTNSPPIELYITMS
jgi:hypothetical protein